MKTKYKIFVAISIAILIAFISRKIADARRSAYAKKSYKDKNIMTAQNLYNALYPDGKPNARFMFFAPLLSSLNLVKDVFKASPDTERIMSIARDDISDADFKKIAKAYKILYRADLMFDLQNALDDDYKRFSSILRTKKDNSDKPEQNKRRLTTLAKLIYEDVYAVGLANDDLYQELYDLPDNDFIFTNDEFGRIAYENGTHDTLAQEIADDSWSIDLSKELARRFRKLGIA